MPLINHRWTSTLGVDRVHGLSGFISTWGCFDLVVTISASSFDSLTICSANSAASLASRVWIMCLCPKSSSTSFHLTGWFILSSPTQKGKKKGSKRSFFPHRGQSLVLRRVSQRYARVSCVSTYAVRRSMVFGSNKLLSTDLSDFTHPGDVVIDWWEVHLEILRGRDSITCSDCVKIKHHILFTFNKNSIITDERDHRFSKRIISRTDNHFQVDINMIKAPTILLYSFG